MALTFNGSTQYLSNASAVVSADPLTIAAWFYPTSLTNTGSIAAVSRTADGTGADIRALRYRGDLANDPIQSQHGGLAATAISGATTLNAWQHGATVFVSSTDRSIYLNGTRTQNTNFVTLTSGAAETYIGAWSAFGSVNTHFAGRVAEVGIWNVALTPAEVGMLAKGYSPLMVRPASLAFYCPVIGRMSPEIDIVGGYNMTLNNAPTVVEHQRVLRPAGLWVPRTGSGGGPAPSAYQPRHGATMFGGVAMV